MSTSFLTNLALSVGRTDGSVTGWLTEEWLYLDTAAAWTDQQQTNHGTLGMDEWMDGRMVGQIVYQMRWWWRRRRLCSSNQAADLGGALSCSGYYYYYRKVTLTRHGVECPNCVWGDMEIEYLYFDCCQSCSNDGSHRSTKSVKTKKERDCAHYRKGCDLDNAPHFIGNLFMRLFYLPIELINKNHCQKKCKT